MNGVERVRAVFKGEVADRVPFYPIVSGLAAKLIDLKPREYYTDFSNLARAHIALFEWLRHDVIALMGDLFVEVEAMGAKVEFPENGLPMLRTYILEDKGKLNSLKVPDPASEGRLPSYLDACRKVKEAIKDSPIGGVICGPWTIACNLRGAGNLLIDTKTDPDFVHDLMAFSVEVCKTYALAVRNAGVGLSLSEAPASISLISPRIYRDFVFPYQKRLIEDLRTKKIGVTLHICGFIDPIIEDVAESGAVALSMDRPSSLELALEKCSGKAVVIGNVSTEVFVRGDQNEIEKEVRRCLEIGKKKGYILSTGCEISPRGELERVRIFCELAERLARYD